jgi:transcriptional regulator GlxA family with amidase domain
VLDGHQVTTHWALADEFRAAFPRVRLVEQALHTDDGQVLTSGGMLAATDLCLHVPPAGEPATPVRRVVAVHQEPGHATQRLARLRHGLDN